MCTPMMKLPRASGSGHRHGGAKIEDREERAERKESGKSGERVERGDRGVIFRFLHKKHKTPHKTVIDSN